jgi:hypothetical protein
MTDEELLKLAKSYGFDRHISKTTNDIYWECDEEDLLKFARELYDKAYGVGYDIGAGDEYDRGYIDGVESVRSGVLGD